MKKINLILFVFLTSFFTNVEAQYISDFDTFALQPDTFWDGSDMTGGFIDAGTYFVNYYDTSYGGFWNGGFAYSNMIDTVTAGYMNEFSVMTGHAYSGNNFAVVNPGAFNTTYLKPNPVAKISGMYITNSTYAYISMRDGDAYAKKFGGTSGDDPDWFKLTVIGYINETFTDSVEFYLADFRFSDNAQDYIVKDWTWVDMLALGNVDSVAFRLSSSDVGMYGMNTPAFFCIDHIQYETTGIDQPKNETILQVFPNPATDKVFVNATSEIERVELLSLDGKILLLEEPQTMQTQIDINAIPEGIYFIRIESENNFVVKKIIKQ